AEVPLTLQAAAGSYPAELALVAARVQRAALTGGHATGSARPASTGTCERPPEVVARVLGQLEVLVDGREPQDDAWKRATVRELLFFMLAHPKVRTKAEIEDRLWPQVTGDEARKKLNQAVYHLRKAIYRDCVVTRGETLQLNPGGRFWFDAAEFD